MECFKCSSCDCKLLPGDQYGISNGRLLCRSDLDVLCEGVQSPTGQPKGGAGDLYLCLKCAHVFVCTCVCVCVLYHQLTKDSSLQLRPTVMSSLLASA